MKIAAKNFVGMIMRAAIEKPGFSGFVAGAGLPVGAALLLVRPFFENCAIA